MVFARKEKQTEDTKYRGKGKQQNKSLLIVERWNPAFGNIAEKKTTMRAWPWHLSHKELNANKAIPNM